MNKEQLINEIRNGKALHYDIDYVELLNDVCYEAGKCQPISYKGKYYLLGKFFWHHTDLQPTEYIKLSDFIPKMISVEAVKDKLNEMLQDYQDEGNSDNSNINNRVIGAIRACNQLLTFLNSHTNVK